MNFTLEHDHINKTTTFSPEGCYSFLTGFFEVINRTFARILQRGFAINEPVKHVEIHVEWVVNGKKLSDEFEHEILKLYPNNLGLNREALIQFILENYLKEKAGDSDGAL